MNKKINICIFLLHIPIILIAKQLQTNPIKHVIWDAGSTLIAVNHIGIAQEMGAKTVIKMVFKLGGKKKIHKYMLEVLEQYAGKQIAHKEEDLLSNSPYGQPLPHFMSDTWLCSRISNQELVQHISTAVDQWNPQKEVSASKRQLLKKILQTALSSDTLGKYSFCPSSALNIVKKISEKGFNQYILSNFDKESFDIAYANDANQELWAYIPKERIVISGDCGLIKPYQSMFAYFLEKYQLQPEECLLIDDQRENIDAATKYGIQTIHLRKPHYHRLARKLKKLNLLD